MRVKVLKRSSVATESEGFDGFYVGEVLDLSATLAFLLTAAGWVRRIFERRAPRRAVFSRVPLDLDRRLLPDRRAMEAA